MSASSDDSISKGSSPSVKTGSRSKNHSEQLLKNAKKKVKLVKLPKSSGSSRIDVDYSPNQIPPQESQDNHFKITGKEKGSPSLRHSISNKERQNWKLTQGRRDMVENQS